MSEQTPNPAIPEPRVPSIEEARAGFYLQPTEAVALDIPSNPNRTTRAWNIGHGIKVAGMNVADIRIGGAETYAVGTVIKTSEGEAILAITHQGSPDAFTVGLEKGQMWGMGRRFEGQADLPDTVSGDHCAVGLDEQGRLVIENHEPTNQTSVRTI